MDRPVDSFSKGMRQRAKLAQAIAHDPQLVVLDEPLNGLDPVARREMTALIRSFGEEGKCVLVSSHVLHEVEAMTHRVLLLSHGMVVAEGTIEQIRRDLSDRPLAIRVETPDPRALAAHFVTMEGVRRVDVDPTRVDVMTTRPTDLFRELARLASEDHVSITRYRSLDESLEAVFRYLTS
jgi:ABC-2 type transport system ATP-binding protein